MKNNTLAVQRFLILAFVLTFSTQLFAAGFVQLRSGSENRLDVNESSYLRLQVMNTFTSFQYVIQNTPQGSFAQLTSSGYSKSSVIGDPELPVLSRLIEIPAGTTPEVRVVSYQIVEYRLSDYGIADRIFPLQSSQPKNSTNIEFKYNASTYAQDQFIGGEIARVEVAGYLRGVRLANLILSPVSYNPVTNTIRVYDNLVVDVSFPGADISQTKAIRSKYDSPYFHSIFSNVVNLQPLETVLDTMAKKPVKYVIVSPPMFQDALQPLVQWKTRKGFTVVEAYTNNPQVGTTFNSIKAYLENLYTSSTPADPAPSFILFVGDVAQIPAYNCGGHVSDLYYCEYTGDFLPEVYYGRFSATNLAQLQPQIDKTLEYEQYLMPDPSYLNECVMVAGADASYASVWGNGQINYGTTYWFNPDHNLLSHTYLQPEPPGGNYSQNIQNNVSNGVCYANYTAHGGVSGWSDPSFEISDIPALQNAHKYSLMVGNCCLTNTFDQDCFGEELLRAADKGALGYIGASNSSYWDEDYWWGVGVGQIVVNPTYETHGLGAYARTFHDRGEPYAEWYSSQGQMVFAGNLAVQESNSGNKQYYWEIYCLMGDPSLMIYYSEPPALSVQYDPLLPLGSPVFTVETDPYALVALSRNNILHGVMEADSNGLAYIPITPFSEPGYAHVVITKQNRQPYIDSVMVASPQGPYLILDSYTVNDEGGNNNQIPEFSEPLTVDMAMENFGTQNAVNAVSTLTTADPYVSITSPTYVWPLILSNGSATANDAFSIQTHDFIPDQHVASFMITTQADTSSFISYFEILFSAPKLISGVFSVEDVTGGNGNGFMEPGETIYVTIPTTNEGHCTSSEVLTQLFAFGQYITVNTPSQTYPPLAPGSTFESTFSFTISPDAPLGYEFSLYFTAIAGPYTTVSSLFPSLGPQIEDFETNNFNRYSWRMSGDQNWKISNSIKWEGSYGSMSGNIGNSQISEMYLDVIVYTSDTLSFFRKVSSEAGYDFLRFYLDDIVVGEWSGNLDWQRVSFFIPAGSHRFKWSYQTDVAYLAGQNSAWVDFIEFPPFSENPTGPLSVNTVAIPAAVCPGGSTQLYAFTTGGNGNYIYTWEPAASLNNPNVFNPIATPTENTTYHVLVTSMFFNTSSDIPVIMNPAPATPVVTVSSDHLTSSSATGNQWYNSAGEIPGATGQDYTPLHTDLYYVIVTNENGCVSAPSNEVYFGFTGLEKPVATGLKAYPNPFGNLLHIDYNVKQAGNVRVTLFDAIGNEIVSQDMGEQPAGNHKTSFDTSSLSAGIYYCKLFTGNSVQVIKVIRNK